MFNKVTVTMFAAVLGLGIANAALITEIKATPEDARKFARSPKIVEVDGKKVFTAGAKPGWGTYFLKEKIKVDPAKKYQVSLKLKQAGEKPAYVYIGFVPYTKDGKAIWPQHGANNTKGSFTSLTEAAEKGAKEIKVKDASKWQKGKRFYIGFNAKEDMSDIPNFDISSMIAKIEGNTITLTRPLKKAYPAGTKVRQHRTGSTYVYMKHANAPEEWTVWKGKPAQGAILRKATHIAPLILVRVKKDTGVVFTDFKVEEF